MFGSLIDSYRLWRLKREAIRTLHSFDDRQLNDVGAFRDNIETFVAEHAKLDLPPGRGGPARYRSVVTQPANLETRKRVTP